MIVPISLLANSNHEKRSVKISITLMEHYDTGFRYSLGFIRSFGI